ncbi:MAG: glycosyltransferase family 4 protein [Desulfoprunum sp.]|uniref:glycosyltransferase family 4 protein n=1 Tax=Desulfoprunum sp. TaxID=2020866 RepID=UPI003C70C9E6
MRILLLSFYYPPDLSAGSFRAKALIESLAAVVDGPLHVDVMTSMPNRYHSMSNKAPEFETEHGLTIRRIPLPAHQSGMVDQAKAFAVNALAVLRATGGQKWDVVVATSSRLMTAALGARVANRCGAPLYLDIRDLFTDTMADVLNGSPVRMVLPFFRWLERNTLRSASRVNLVSAGFLSHVRNVAPQHDYRVFTNGIDEEFLDFDFQKRQSSDGLPPLVVYAGNMGEGQGLHNIVPKAARLLDGKVRIRLVGDGGRRGQLEKELSEAGVSNVEVLNPVPRAELYTHYREADVLFLHLNDYQAFRKVLPSKLFEYAATGKPVLAGVAGHSADFLKQEVPGVEVFAPCDAEGMAVALERLLSVPTPVDREMFRVKFARRNIMEEMARDILELGGAA